MQLVNFLFLIFFLFGSAWANEGGGGGGEHGGGGAPAVEADYSGKQSQEWSEVQTKLAALKSKVEAQEALVKSLIAETGGGHGSAGSGGLTERIEQLKKEHQKLQTMISDYNKMNASYETRFPEKGLKESRIYRRADPQAIKSDGSASNYEERVQHLQSKILRQYPRTANTLRSKKQKKNSNAPKQENVKEHSEKKPDVESKKSGDVTDQIILKK